MENHKTTNISEAAAAAIAAQWVAGDISSVERVAEGKIASTFDCEANNEHFIVQFNQPNMATSYRKERFFATRFQEAGIPVREVVGNGEFAGSMYTVAKRVEGSALSNLTPELFEEALPSVFTVLRALDSIDIGDTSGFGWYDKNGVGNHDAWLGHLSQIQNEEPGMYYGHWYRLFDATFLERDRFDRYFSKMVALAADLDFPRRLVHGGFGYNNLLVNNREVSVVLDWQDSLFGDHLKDIAYMDYWPSGFDLPRLYEMHCKDHGAHHVSFYRRIAVCKLYQGLDSMRYFAKVGNKNAYHATIRLVEKVYSDA